MKSLIAILALSVSVSAFAKTIPGAEASFTKLLGYFDSKEAAMISAQAAIDGILAKTDAQLLDNIAHGKNNGPVCQYGVSLKDIKVSLNEGSVFIGKGIYVLDNTVVEKYAGSVSYTVKCPDMN